MNLLTAFIFLVERRQLGRALATASATAMLLIALFGLQAAHAQTASSKIATDLQTVINASTTPKTTEMA